MRNIHRPSIATPKGPRKKDGRSKHPLYKTYQSMIDRCYNPGNKRFKNYEGKGICEEWLSYPDGFWTFVEDMGNRPDGYSIDRVDVSKGYSPENCKWASNMMQSGNRSNRREHTGVFPNSSGSYNATITVTFKTIEEAIAQRNKWEQAVIGSDDIVESAIKAGINL